MVISAGSDHTHSKKARIKFFVFNNVYLMQKTNFIPQFVSKILKLTEPCNVIDQKYFSACPGTSAHTHLKKLHQFVPSKDV